MTAGGRVTSSLPREVRSRDCPGKTAGSAGRGQERDSRVIVLLGLCLPDVLRQLEARHSLLLQLPC